MPHKYLQAIEKIRLIDRLPGASKRMQPFVDITLSRLGGLRKIVVEDRAFHLRRSFHELAASERMFVHELRQRGLGCKVVFEYPKLGS
jgi:hypothetical protein